MSKERESLKWMDTERIAWTDKQKADLKRGDNQDKLNITLTVVQGSDVDFGKTYNLETLPVRIGRDKSSAIRVNDYKVSKQHCEISLIKTGDLEQIIIKDLNSTNGTFVNEQAIEQRILDGGDRITVGATILRFSYNDEIEEVYRSKLFSFAATDALTGLYNRRYILNELEAQSRIARRNDRVFSIAIFDIDNFKQINDTYGHPAGDDYLKNIAHIISHSLREQDISGRIGGEEFLIILPETDIDGAFHLADRIRRKIQALAINHDGNLIKTTISAGLSQFKAHASSTGAGMDTLFQMADKALYEAKNTGKNKVVKGAVAAR
jgi:diguanylate cyclase (GGDEF)-like protein